MTDHFKSAALLLLIVLIGNMPAAARERSQGDLLMGSHRFDEAEQAYRDELKQSSGSDEAEVIYQIGESLKSRYKMDDAIVEYKKAINHPAGDSRLTARALVAIGQAHQHQNRLDDAMAAYDQVLEMEAAEPQVRAHALLFGGYTLNKAGQTDLAIDRLKQVRTVEGAQLATKQQGLIAAGKILQRQQRYAEALPLFEAALDISEEGGISEFARNGAIECRTALEADPRFYLAPYTTLVSDTEASIFWVSLGDTPAGRVVVTGGPKTINAQAKLVKLADRDAYRQTVRLTDLQPYTLYHYVAHCDGETAEGYFHTARNEPGPIRFVAMGDTQTGWQHHQRIAPLIAAENPDFVLHVGDCVDAGQEWDQWKLQMFDPGKPYLSKAPIWVARGNHDGGRYFLTLFGREDNPWVSFTFGNLRVLVLESTYHMGERNGVQQLAWLEQQLESSDSRWTVATMHHSLFHTANGDRLVGQTNFRPLIEKFSPDVVINGHYHKYSRQLPIGKPGAKPVINIVTGGAGGGNGTPSTLSPIVEKVYQSFHYTVFEIDGDTMKLTAKDIEGNVIDRMTWTKDEDGNFQEEVMAKAVDPATFTAVRMVYNDLKFPRYNRQDLTGTTTEQDGQPVVVLDRNVLDITKLPEDTQLVIEAAENTSWQVPRQTLNLSKGELTINAAPPADNSDAPLKVNATLKLNDRLFEPQTFDVTLAK